MNQVVNTQPRSLKQYVSDDKIRQKFAEVLGEKSKGFLASVMQVANSPALKNADPATVINAAMMAATLDLPINNNLGFAYIVPFKTEAQFQMGYKGFIQLAQRSGQFSRIAATPVYQGQLVSADPLLGYEFDWTVEPEGEPIGYVAFFKLLNGFTADLYMSKKKVEEHAKRYSQTYKRGFGVWKDNFEAMALKTVLKLLLSKQAPLSIEMQKAIELDQGVIDEEGNASYIDNGEQVEKTAARLVSEEDFPNFISAIESGNLTKEHALNASVYALSEEQRKKVASL